MLYLVSEQSGIKKKQQQPYAECRLSPGLLTITNSQNSNIPWSPQWDS